MENIDMMSIRQDGRVLGYIKYIDGKIVTEGEIGKNSYDNYVDLIKGLWGYGIKIDDFYT